MFIWDARDYTPPTEDEWAEFEHQARHRMYQRERMQKPPTQAVIAERLGVSLSTYKRWKTLGRPLWALQAIQHI